MPASVLQSDGAVNDTRTLDITPEEMERLRQIVGLSAPRGMVNPRIQSAASITLESPNASWPQEPAEEGPNASYPEPVLAKPMDDTDVSSLLGGYGIDPIEFMGESPTQPVSAPVYYEDFDPTSDQPSAVDISTEATVPGSAPRPQGGLIEQLDGDFDPFDFKVRQAHEGLRPEMDKWFAINSDQDTTAVMRAVESGEMDTAKALAILNARTKVTELEKQIHQEDQLRKRKRSPRDRREEALFRVFGRSSKHTPMDPAPYLEY